MDQAQIDQFSNSLESARSLLILLPPEPERDSTVAALALRDAVSASGKQIMVGCSSDVAQKYPDLLDAELIKPTIGQQTLVVSFDYKEDAIENVSYDIDDTSGKFNLRIQPRPNTPPLDSSRVEFSYTGAAADLVITLGIHSLEELGKLYADEKAFLDTATFLSLVIGPKPANLPGTQIHLTTTNLSEGVLSLLHSASLSLTAETATLLFGQLTQSTNNFASPSVTADTFETAAYLLRHGARKTPVFPTKPYPASPFLTPAESETTPSPTGGPTPHPAKDWSGPKVYRSGTPLH